MVTKYIKVRGKDQPIRFSQAAIMRFSRSQGMSMRESQNFFGSLNEDTLLDMDLETFFDLILHGFKDGARKDGIDFDYTIDDIADWVEEDPDLVGRVFEAFGEDMPQVDAVEVVAEGEV